MLMSKNVNNDVSKDSPISYLSGSSRFDDGNGNGNATNHTLFDANF